MPSATVVLVPTARAGRSTAGGPWRFVTSPGLSAPASVGGTSPRGPRGPLHSPLSPTGPSSFPSPSSDDLTGSVSILVFGVMPAACLLEALRRKLSRLELAGPLPSAYLAILDRPG